MSPVPQQRRKRDAEASLDGFWCGMQTAVGEHLLQNFLARCSQPELGPTMEICTPCGWHETFEEGDLVTLAGGTRGEVVEVDHFREGFPLRVCTLDGESRWCTQAKLTKLRLGAKEASDMHAQIAACLGLAQPPKLTAPPIPKEHSLLVPEGSGAGGFFIGVAPRFSRSMSSASGDADTDKWAGLRDSSVAASIMSSPDGLREAAETFANAAWEALVGDPEAAGKSFDEEVLRAARVHAALEEMSAHDAARVLRRAAPPASASKGPAGAGGEAAGSDDEAWSAAPQPPIIVEDSFRECEQDPFQECDIEDLLQKSDLLDLDSPRSGEGPFPAMANACMDADAECSLEDMLGSPLKAGEPAMQALPWTVGVVSC